MNTGIYCIENIINNKKYIGQAINLKKREYEHFRMLKNNSHRNNHLQNSYNIYGENSFLFKILLYCESFELTKYEQFFVDLYTSEILYNVRLECVNNNIGIVFSDETKKKISESNKGKNKGKSGPRLGKYHSEESKKKIGEARKEKYFGKNHPFYGKHHSEETKKKIALKASERIVSDKARENMSKSQIGRVTSEETKNKISKANSGKKLPGRLSSYFGVHKDATRYKDKLYVYWKAELTIKNKRINIGKYKNEIDAAVNYDKYVIKNNLNRPLNFPENINLYNNQ